LCFWNEFHASGSGLVEAESLGTGTADLWQKTSQVVRREAEKAQHCFGMSLARSGNCDLYLNSSCLPSLEAVAVVQPLLILYLNSFLATTGCINASPPFALTLLVLYLVLSPLLFVPRL
jgi:hypothetical protein